jgi:hypothetical protein
MSIQRDDEDQHGHAEQTADDLKGPDGRMRTLPRQIELREDYLLAHL